MAYPTQRVAGRVALWTALGVVIASALWQGGAALGGEAWAWQEWLVATAVTAGLAGLITGAITHRTLGRRVARLATFLEEQASGGDALQRLAPLGDDEVGRAARAVNALLSSMTSLRVSVIDQGRELAETQEELRLKEELASKTGELEQRLRERALLFDVLRISASETQLDTVVAELARRLGDAMRLRELAILLREGEGDADDAEGDRFVIRAAHGFDDPEDVLGRYIERGEGIAGEVAEGLQPLVVPDVSIDPEYLAFWGKVRREGSFAAFPILHREELIGLVALTRPPEDPLAPEEVKLLSAITDPMALAIQRGRLFEELRDMSTHDELTGLANRRLLRGRLEMELDRARRFGHSLSVLAADIVHFKLLNDRCGHLTGDAALREVASSMRGSVRRVDTVARTGGEEYEVLLPQTSLAEAEGVADKLRRHVEARSMPGGEGQPDGRLTISVGVAALGERDDMDSLLERADRALYRAKQAGRNCVVSERELSGRERFEYTG
ncbi:MAG: diguanylate cyclase [Polyangiales bacterium]